MKIIHYETSPEDQSFRISTGNSVESLPEILTSKNAASAAAAEVVTVFVNSLVDKTTIDALKNCKLIVTRSTGFDHIDVAYANSKGITVCNVPAYGSRTVAEFVFALLLNLSRKVYKAVEQIPLHNDWDISNFEGFNLQGKTLGVIGTGRIGQNVIQIANGFGMNVVANDAFPNEAKATELNFRYMSLDELLSVSDVV
ncbi:MAG TPA: NAD(P)-dependent oxidoreductase, partial [Patescibacteria group bacterium]|nr:NAD(P)-dependent oxidoreductase [Patescibacteria group bacterium]